MIRFGFARLRELTVRFAARARSWPMRRMQGALDAGMTTAEYAVGTIAAVAFAALLYKVITSSQILDALTNLVSRALHAPF